MNLKFFKAVTHGLREKIQQAVDEEYLRALKQPMIGYARVMPKEMLDHLKS